MPEVPKIATMYPPMPATDIWMQTDHAAVSGEEHEAQRDHPENEGPAEDLEQSQKLFAHQPASISRIRMPTTIRTGTRSTQIVTIACAPTPDLGCSASDI
jgi:hypothetical protein